MVMEQFIMFRFISVRYRVLGPADREIFVVSGKMADANTEEEPMEIKSETIGGTYVVIANTCCVI